MGKRVREKREEKRQRLPVSDLLSLSGQRPQRPCPRLVHSTLYSRQCIHSGAQSALRLPLQQVPHQFASKAGNHRALASLDLKTRSSHNSICGKCCCFLLATQLLMLQRIRCTVFTCTCEKKSESQRQATYQANQRYSRCLDMYVCVCYIPSC